MNSARWVMALLTAGLCAAVSRAQSLAPSAAAAAVAQAGAEDARIDSARSLLKSGSTQALEGTLLAANISARNSGAWYLESGSRLAWLASSLRNQKDPTAARQAATLAIQYLTTADQQLSAEGKAVAAGRAQVAIARLYERVLFDDLAAGKAYAAALSRDGSSAVAQAALAARQRADDKLKEKVRPKGGS